MWTRLGLALGLLLCGVAPALADGFVESSGTYAEGAQIRGNRYDTGGNQKVTLGTLLSGEDQTNGVMKVEQQFSSSGIETADVQIKASAGYVDSITCYGTDNAAVAGTIILYDNTAESGTIIWSWTVAALDYHIPFTVPLHVTAATGLYLGYTTTTDVNCTVVYR